MKISLPPSLSYSQISCIVMDPITLAISILFLVPHIESLEKYQVNFRKVLLFSVSKSADDEEGDYVVGAVELSSELDAQKIIDGIGRKGIIHTVPPERVFHLHVEGDICCDLVSEEYEIIRIN